MSNYRTIFNGLSSSSTYSSRRDVRDGYRELLKELISPEYDLDAHFVFNRTTSAEGFERTLNEFLDRIDRHCLGNKFFRKPLCERSSLIVFTEHPNSNRHGHGFLRPGRMRKSETVTDYRAECARIWKKLERAGNLDIGPIQSFTGAIFYNTKDLVRLGASDLVYLRGVFKNW